MKKFILIIMVLISLTAAVELKGVQVGVKYIPQQGDTTIVDNAYENTYARSTTLGGIEGWMVISTVKDGRVYQVAWTPEGRVLLNDALTIINGYKNKYNVTLEEKGKAGGNGGEYLKTKRDGYLYGVRYEKNEYMEKPVEITVGVSSIELLKLKEKDKQIEANKDF